MTMRDIDELLPDVLTHASKCPEPLALRMLRDAAREFCKRSRIWMINDTIQVSAPEWEGICTNQDAAIVRIEAARMNDRTLEPVMLKVLDDKRPGWDSDTEEADPRYITQQRPNTITIYPRQTGTITARLVLQPSRSAMQLPDFLIDDYARDIASGALGDILLVPGTEYVNPQLGAYHKSEFEKAVRLASRAAVKGQTGAPVRSIPGFF